MLVTGEKNSAAWSFIRLPVGNSQYCQIAFHWLLRINAEFRNDLIPHTMHHIHSRDTEYGRAEAAIPRRLEI